MRQCTLVVVKGRYHRDKSKAIRFWPVYTKAMVCQSSPKDIFKFDDVLGLTELGKRVVMKGYSLILVRRKIT